MTQAVASQVRLDAPPLWDRAPAAVVFYTDPSAVPAQAHGIAIVDTIQDQPQGVLGFHTEDQGGKLWGRGRGQAGARQRRQAGPLARTRRRLGQAASL